MDGDQIGKIMEETPLLGFSLYTATQVQSLQNIGKEIIDLSSNWNGTITDSPRVYDLFWLWVLGAYEVLRTMGQHLDCFSEPLKKEITNNKKLFANIRMPFAKQELQGSKGPVYAEPSVVGFANGMKFEISGVTYESNRIIEDFLIFIDSIEIGDVVGKMPLRQSD